MKDNIKVQMNRPCGNKDGWKFLDSDQTLTVWEWVLFLYDRLDGAHMNIKAIDSDTEESWESYHVHLKNIPPKLYPLTKIKDRKVASIIWNYKPVTLLGGAIWNFDFLLAR